VREEPEREEPVRPGLERKAVAAGVEATTTPVRPERHRPGESTDEVVVHGRRHDDVRQGDGDDGVRAYVLDERLVGHDSYRIAELVLADDATVVRVRVLTLDDVTTICPLAGEPSLPDRWEGRLILRSRERCRRMPPDLEKALTAAGLDPATLDAVQRRHLVGFVSEARPGPTRDARLAVAVAAVAAAQRRGVGSA
jgi:hypothetical protein